MSRRSQQRNYAQRANKRERGGEDRNARRRDEFGFPAQHSRETFEGEKSESDKGWNRFKERQLALLPERLPTDPGKRLIRVFVEGYEDVSFWRGIFDNYESRKLTFEINVPPREDLAKGKKVLMSMIPDSSPDILLCVDSDFDYLFGNQTEQSRTINNSKYMFQTYAYAAENFLCYPASLHNVCVKATKNDTRIFDFERFMADYSRTIYPLFIWYAYSARLKSENVFTLNEFKGSVKLNYMEVENNGEGTLGWLKRQVDKRLAILERHNPDMDKQLHSFERTLLSRGLTAETAYLYMQGHTLLDNVVMVMLNAVCEQLKVMSNIRITTSTKTGIALKNELSNYNNALRSVRDILLDNEGYKHCSLYRKLERDIELFLSNVLK